MEQEYTISGRVAILIRYFILILVLISREEGWALTYLVTVRHQQDRSTKHQILCTLGEINTATQTVP